MNPAFKKCGQVSDRLVGDMLVGDSGLATVLPCLRRVITIGQVFGRSTDDGMTDGLAINMNGSGAHDER